MHKGILVLSLLCIMFASSLKAEPKTDSPAFPDVWEWRPTFPAIEWAYMDFYQLPDNDILISYSNNASPQKKHEAVGFFSGRKFKSAEAAFGVPPGSPLLPGPDKIYPAKLPNGKIVTTYSQGECSRGYGSRISVTDSQYNPLITKTLLLVLDVPRQAPSVLCEETNRPGFSQSLVIFRPNRILPLSDNTFLVSDLTTGTVVRLDESLNTKSTSLGKSLFIVEPALLDNYVKKYYREAPEYGVDWQNFLQDLRLKMIRELNKKNNRNEL